MARTVAIIQARTGSTRLPGKIFNTLGDKTVIQHVFERVRQTAKLDDVVVAIPLGAQDDGLADHVSQFCPNISRGSEADVLDRYRTAAKESNASTVVRITSDCPFFDPDILSRMLEEFLTSDVQYMTNTLIPHLPRGLDAEVFSNDVLEIAWTESCEPHQREHVTPFIYQHPNRFTLKGFRYFDANYSNLRWTLDTPKDWELIKRIHSLLEIDFSRARTEDFLHLYQENPELREINSDILQKPLIE